jgi:hypothetical protein
VKKLLHESQGYAHDRGWEPDVNDEGEVIYRPMARVWLHLKDGRLAMLK